MSQIAPTAPQMLVSNVVQIVNEHPTDSFVMKYGPTQRLELAPYGSIDVGGNPTDRLLVNEEVAWHFLGKWWADNSNPRERARVGEVQRLRTLYGAYEDDVAWSQSKVHHLKAYTPAGQPIVTVVDDPEGAQMVGGQTPIGREMSLESQLEVMRQHTAQLEARLAQQERRIAEQPNAEQQVPPDARPPAPAAPYNPATAPPPVPTVAGVAVPVAPATVGLPQTVGIPVVPNATAASVAATLDPDAEELGVIGSALPVRTSVAYDPSEAEVPEDAPAVVKQTSQGGQIR